MDYFIIMNIDEDFENFPAVFADNVEDAYKKCTQDETARGYVNDFERDNDRLTILQISTFDHHTYTHYWAKPFRRWVSEIDNPVIL